MGNPPLCGLYHMFTSYRYINHLKLYDVFVNNYIIIIMCVSVYIYQGVVKQNKISTYDEIQPLCETKHSQLHGILQVPSSRQTITSSARFDKRKKMIMNAPCTTMNFALYWFVHIQKFEKIKKKIHSCIHNGITGATAARRLPIEYIRHGCMQTFKNVDVAL
jgi:hypothetical protein